MDNQLVLLGYIDRKTKNEVIYQRVTDGYFNATAMCKAVGKQWRDYARHSLTKPYVDALSNDARLPHNVLIQSIGLSESNGNPYLQGTWVHPQIAVHLAMWLSPEFSVLVTKWFTEWVSGNIQKPNLPYHLRRYMANMHNVPPGYFSILNEITLHLIGPMEQLGYTLSGKQVPDISLGKLFSNHLRKNGYDVKLFPEYLHQYEDGRIYPARAYPNELLSEIRKYFVEVWLKDHSVRYFKERDPEALSFLNKLLALPNYREAMGYIEYREKKATELDDKLITALNYSDKE